jgi:ABC-2 type transport system permease protein
VRPLVWLVVFAAGFRAVLGISIIPPYETYIRYEVYVVPGLLGMVLLFNGMQSSLSMVYDREMGVMRLLLTAPLPRWVLLACKLVAGTLQSVITCYVFLLVCIPFGVTFDAIAWLYVVGMVAIVEATGSSMQHQNPYVHAAVGPPRVAVVGKAACHAVR